MKVTKDGAGDHVCEHGTALDVHCCHCHNGFIFDPSHECPSDIPEAEDYGDGDDPDEEAEFDCHMDQHGSCGLAGTEECEFECLYRREEG